MSYTTFGADRHRLDATRKARPCGLTAQERSILSGLLMPGGWHTYERTRTDRTIFDAELAPLLLALAATRRLRIDRGASRMVGERGQSTSYVAITAELTNAGREARQP